MGRLYKLSSTLKNLIPLARLIPVNVWQNWYYACWIDRLVTFVIVVTCMLHVDGLYNARPLVQITSISP